MILVTGASGLVGSHLIHFLSQKKQKIRALYKTKIPTLLDGTLSEFIEWIQGDITDIAEMESYFENITHIYHCAAIVSYDPRHKDEMICVNVEGTSNIVNCSLEFGVKKLVFISSIAAIGKSNTNEAIKEKNIWNHTNQNSNYAVSKHHAEMEVWRGAAEGLQVVIVNPAVILGEGDWSKSSTNLFQIVDKEFPFYTSGTTAWVDVKDVVKACILLMDSEVTQERFILSAGNYSFKNIFTWMAVAMNKKPPQYFAKKWMSEIVWRWSYLKALLTKKIATISKETAQAAYSKYDYDNQKFLSQFPEFEYTPVQETIGRIAKYFIENKARQQNET